MTRARAGQALRVYTRLRVHSPCTEHVYARPHSPWYSLAQRFCAGARCHALTVPLGRKWEAFCQKKTAHTAECDEQEDTQAELKKIHQVCACASTDAHIDAQ